MISYREEVVLDSIELDMLDEIRLWRNDPRVYKWCRQDNLITDSDQLEWYHRQRKDPSTRMFLVRGDGGKPIGVCGLTSIDMVANRAEFSLYINPRVQGRGYGKAALKTLFKYGFDAMGLHLIWGETFSKNPAQHLFEKIGMKKEGVRRAFYFKEGQYVDTYLYSIVRGEFYGWRVSEPGVCPKGDEEIQHQSESPSLTVYSPR